MTNEPDSSEMKFEVLKSALGHGASSARLGRVALPRGQPLETPGFFSIASRGFVPHLTPDMLSKHGQTRGAYMALEDFIEKKATNATTGPHIYRTPSLNISPLHTFTAMPVSMVTVMGARRFPAQSAPVGNGNNHISIFTSSGFQNLTTEDYYAAAQTLRPDIVIPPTDSNHLKGTPKSARAIRMAERSEAWLDWWISKRSAEAPSPPPSIFAPVGPFAVPWQRDQLSRFADAAEIAGLAVYNTALLADIAAAAPTALSRLPRLSLDEPATPHQVLDQIERGVDVFLLPFLNAVSDAGVALTFTFPAPSSAGGGAGDGPLPLGVDMTAPAHAASLSPLRPGCACYACAAHHAAFVHHLLAAREMLAWTLLQVHNHAVVADFFAGVRGSLADGTFAAERERFGKVYEAALPMGVGERPRARGHHFKSEKGEGRRNTAPWKKEMEGEEGEGMEQGKRGEVLEVEDGEEVVVEVPGVTPSDVMRA